MRQSRTVEDNLAERSVVNLEEGGKENGMAAKKSKKKDSHSVQETSFTDASRALSQVQTVCETKEGVTTKAGKGGRKGGSLRRGGGHKGAAAVTGGRKASMPAVMVTATEGKRRSLRGKKVKEEQQQQQQQQEEEELTCLPEKEEYQVILDKDDKGLGITVAGYVCEKGQY